MKFLALFLAVVLLAVSIFAAPADDPPTRERKCAKGKGYYDGCNQCWCTISGTACTRRGCSTFGPNGTVIPRKPNPPPEDYWQQE